MTAEERRAHHEALRNFTTAAECRAYMEAHHAQMQARARELGWTLPERPQGHPRCESLALNAR
jgi:hypothetical protein